MSRWLAIFDPRGRIVPEEARKAFSVYPHFRPEELTQLRSDPTCWMGILGPGGHSGSLSGVKVLWDGAVYNWPSPGEEASLLEKAWLAGDRNILASMNGRWSFLLHDPRSHTIWMARDRTGVKPLYYWKAGEYLVFASEPKLILALPFVGRGIDPEAVFDYFVLNKVDVQRETLFKGIRQVLPAHELLAGPDRGIWEERRYYDLSFNPEPDRFDPPTAAKHMREIRRLLNNAVLCRLRRHPGPPATLLSGGLDSSAVACLLRENSTKTLTAITASYQEAGFAEQQWAEIVADHLDARWLQTFPTVEGLEDDLSEFIFSQDTPTFSSGTYAQFCLFRLARQEGAQVVFDGTGADALFAGHLPHLSQLWRDLFRSGQWGTLGREWKAFGSLWKAWVFGGTDWLKNGFFPALPGDMQHRLKRVYFPELQFLNPDLLESNRKRYQAMGGGPHSLNQALQKGYFGGPLSFLLKCVDRASSWWGVDTCTPYSDDSDLMEYVFGVPGSYKIRHGTNKWLLRESCHDILPGAIYGRRDKMGLVTPNNAWMLQLKPIVRSCLEDQDDAVFNKKVFLREFDRFFSPESPLENYRVYKYLSMLLWRSVFKL